MCFMCLLMMMDHLAVKSPQVSPEVRFVRKSVSEVFEHTLPTIHARHVGEERGKTGIPTGLQETQPCRVRLAPISGFR